MAKLNPANIKRPEPLKKVFTLSIGGESHNLEVRRLSATGMMAASENGQRLTSEYVTGFGDPDEEGYIEPRSLPPVDDQPVYASGQAFTMAAIVEFAQTAGDEDRYTALELVMLMCDEDFIPQIHEVFDWVTRRKDAPETQLGKSRKTSGKPSTDSA